MAVARNWLRMDRHSAPQHAWQISDERHMMAYRRSHCRMRRGVNGRDEEEAQSIQRHRLNNQVEIVDWREDHWQGLSEGVPDIRQAQSWFAVV